MSLDERLKSVAQAYLSMHEKTEFVIPEDVPANERTAFHGAAAAAHKAGKKSFSFGGKTHPVTMKKDTASAINSSKDEAVEVEVDKDSEASPEMKKKSMPKGKAKAKKKVDDKDEKDAVAGAEVAEGVDTSPAGNSPPAKAMAARDKEVLDQAKKDTKADKRRDEDKQDGTNAVKEAPKRHNDSKVGENKMKKFKDMR
ncbi:MAG: hypothetical protein CMH04_03805 [Marinovum sp.]|nr:hypothetical protein [Marinovum sp.]